MYTEQVTSNISPSVEIKNINVMTDGKKLPAKMMKEHMITFEKLWQVKEMIT